jgi:hypothetical protein
MACPSHKTLDFAMLAGFCVRKNKKPLCNMPLHRGFSGVFPRRQVHFLRHGKLNTVCALRQGLSTLPAINAWEGAITLPLEKPCFTPKKLGKPFF